MHRSLSELYQCNSHANPRPMEIGTAIDKLEDYSGVCIDLSGEFSGGNAGGIANEEAKKMLGRQVPGFMEPYLIKRFSKILCEIAPHRPMFSCGCFAGAPCLQKCKAG